MGAAGDEIVGLIARAPLFLPLYVLVLCRVGGLMLAAPIYGSEAIPTRIRAGLAAVVALAVFPVAATRLPVDLTLSGAVIGIFGELLIGLTMGLAMSLVFAGFQVAGMVVGQQAGLALGQVFNPVLNTETTILGEVFFLAALTVFVVAGGHRELMRALLDTYDVVPAMSFRFSPPILDLFTDLLTASYTVAMRLAAPVLLALLMATLVMGFLSRTIPQLNILSVGFAVRATIALGFAALTLGAARSLMSGAMADSIDRMREAFGMT